MDIQPNVTEANERLRGFFGGVGTVWNYEAGHSKLIIHLALNSEGKSSELFILCGLVFRIEAPSKWNKNSLQVREGTVRGDSIELYDVDNRVLILMDALRLHEKMPY